MDFVATPIPDALQHDLATASIRPNGDLQRSSRSCAGARVVFFTICHTWVTKCLGMTRERRNAQQRSIVKASATTEQARVGSMTQPPALINSHTMHCPPAQVLGSFDDSGFPAEAEMTEFTVVRDSTVAELAAAGYARDNRRRPRSAV